MSGPGVLYSRLVVTCTFITRLLSALPAAIVLINPTWSIVTIVTETSLVLICGVGGGLKRVDPWWAAVGVGGAAV